MDNNNGKGWLNWSDHPVVVFIVLIAALVGILTGIPSIKTMFLSSTPPSPTEKAVSTAASLVSPTLSIPVPNNPDTVAPLAAGELLFSEDFEDGFSNGFSFNSGKWKVIDDGTGNKVLDQNSNNGDGVIDFPAVLNFSDGIIEFRFRAISGAMQVSFRLISTNQGYTSYPLMYESGGFQLHYQKDGSWQAIEGFLTNGSDQLFNNEWIMLRIEAQDNNLNIFANGNLVISAYDSRISAGRIDFGGNGNTQFDDFKIWNVSQ